MNTSKTMIDEAAAEVYTESPLMEALKEWHGRVSEQNEGVGKFTDWLETQLNYMAGCIHEVTPDNIKTALTVNAMGVPLAVERCDMAKKKGFESDINCYVEDDIVYANVWLKGDNPVDVEKEAAWIAETFNRVGYSAEVWKSEDSENEYTVNAQIDFNLYK